MNLINTLTLEYPRSLWQLREENPNVSFPSEPTDEDLAPFNHANVFPESSPELSDPRTQRMEQKVAPELIDGRFVLGWIVRSATEDEIRQYDDALLPPPNWTEFAIAVMLDPTIEAWYNSIPRTLANGLSIGLNEASKDNAALFIKLWQKLASSSPAAVVATIIQIAQSFYLPSQFITSLSPGGNPSGAQAVNPD